MFWGLAGPYPWGPLALSFQLQPLGALEAPDRGVDSASAAQVGLSGEVVFGGEKEFVD